MEEIIQEALSKGVELHVAGEYDLASQLYESVIKLQPDHPDANHNMGVLKLTTGHDLEALSFLQTALQANTSCTEFWLSYIKALIKLEKLEDAVRILDLAKESGIASEEFVELIQMINPPTESAPVSEPEADIPSQSKPNILDSLKLNQALRLAEKKAKEGNTDEALGIYKDILAKFPKNKQAQQGLAAIDRSQYSTTNQNPPEDVINNLINLYNQGQLSNVIEDAKALTQQYPASFMVWSLLGVAAAQTGQLEKAIFAFQRVIAIQPNNADAYNNMGNVLKDQGKLEEAIESYQHALTLKPDHADAYNNMGTALKNKGKLEEAIRAYIKAIEIKPDFAEAHNNMGNVRKDEGKLEEALEAYTKALALKPDYVEAYSNLGTTLQDQGKLQEAIDAYNKALFLKPDHAEAHKNLSFAFLNVGELKKGLEEYEWRWKSKEHFLQNRDFSIPVWDGQKNSQGKRILLWSEQGIGDTINWSSRLPLISSQAQYCTLECPEKLVPLLSRSFPNVEIKSEDKSRDLQRDDFDFHLPLGSLYRHFIPQILNNPKPDAFLIPDPTRINFWIKRLKSLGPGPYIGVSWKSSDMSPKRLPNYAPISDWCPIFKIDGITFINLQYVDYESDLAKIKSEFGVTVHNFDDLDHYNNIDDVAALCAALDMVVSTKITVPLISSGVGTITKLANWRQSPWNNILLNPVGPEIDIFEKNTWESWDNVFNKIAADIFKMKTRLNSTSESL